MSNATCRSSVETHCFGSQRDPKRSQIASQRFEKVKLPDIGAVCFWRKFSESAILA